MTGTTEKNQPLRQGNEITQFPLDLAIAAQTGKIGELFLKAEQTKRNGLWLRWIRTGPDIKRFVGNSDSKPTVGRSPAFHPIRRRSLRENLPKPLSGGQAIRPCVPPTTVDQKPGQELFLFRL